MQKLAVLAVCAAVLAGLGCGIQDPGSGELPPVADLGHVEQASVYCDTWTDTGYVDGTPFEITLVTADGEPVEVATANAYAVMQEAANAAGVNVIIVSGFRTWEEQEYLYGCHINCSCNNCNLAAPPGYSNHQSGHALDLNTSSSGVLSWLNAHGPSFGFERTVPSEDWHWEWWGGGPGGGPCSAEAPGTPCTVDTTGDSGECMDTGACAALGAHVSTPGYCPGPANIQCCTAVAEPPPPSSPDAAPAATFDAAPASSSDAGGGGGVASPDEALGGERGESLIGGCRIVASGDRGAAPSALLAAALLGLAVRRRRSSPRRASASPSAAGASTSPPATWPPTSGPSASPPTSSSGISGSSSDRVAATAGQRQPTRNERWTAPGSPKARFVEAGLRGGRAFAPIVRRRELGRGARGQAARAVVGPPGCGPGASEAGPGASEAGPGRRHARSW